MDKQIHLTMKGENGEQTADAAPENPPVPIKDQPVIGYLAVGCGLLGIFTWGLVFVPMGLAFSIAALIVGQAGWGFAGLMLAVGGLMTSPTLLTLLGLGALAAFFGIPGF